MKPLLPVGGIVDHRFGILTSYKHKGIPVGIIEGMQWIGDNNCFNNFNPVAFTNWLQEMEPYSSTCLGVVAPDNVGNAQSTIDRFYNWSHIIRWRFPVAFVAQDGQATLPWPLFDFDTLFVGGSTEWKESEGAILCIKRAQALGKHIHIGRVNWKRRYQLFEQIKGSEDFTFDGTRNRFEGIEKTMEAWDDYQNSRETLALW